MNESVRKRHLLGFHHKLSISNTSFFCREVPIDQGTNQLTAAKEENLENFCKPFYWNFFRFIPGLPF